MSKTEKREETEIEEETLLELKTSAKSYASAIGIAVICIFPVITLPITFILLGVIWIALKVNRYKVTNERVILTSGIVSRKVEEVELFRIKDVTVSQGIIDRLMGVGSVKIESVDESTPILKIKGIENPVEVKEQLRKLYRASRKKERVVSTELLYN